MNGKPLLNESELLAKIADGNERAFRDLFDYYQQYVYTFALKISRSDTDAEEIVQDIFLKVWSGRRQLPGIGNFGAYLNRLVRNHTFNLLRHEAIVMKVKTQISLSATENDLGTQQALDYRETKELLDNVVSKLPEQQRRVYALCHFEGLSYDEAAAKLNISPATVHYHMKQALATIRTHFRHYALVCSALIIFFLKNF
ncbi:RNA polymerase sigma-70 factor [Pedobacter deserti]|uniref:RNA polymerase sigma-70 factor n=1 Tax=Pedobacter deserti TaxID=2817382 RepID=UPI00210DC652|nr:RNA polymerase sigma-70 factor [Pedobacter sp. SYSU D00382]